MMSINKTKKQLNAEMTKLEGKFDELKDFAIWMTGCGYDFGQHTYFCEQRDKLLKGDKKW